MPDKKDGLNIIFMGTPDFAACALRNLIDSRHKIIAVYSQPPRPKGRGQQVLPSPVQQTAEEHNIAVYTPVNFKHEDDQARFAAHQADVAVVAAYGLILPQDILNAPKYGCLNIHASLLPRWRGAAPIQRAILAGDEKTGITIMQMEKGLDTGPIISMKEAPIRDNTTAGTLHDRLAALGSAMIEDVLDDLADKGGLHLTPQPDAGITYADKIDKSEGRIDWLKEAVYIDRQIRSFTPWPGCWTQTAGGKRIKIYEAVPESPAHPLPAPAGTILDENGLVACGKGVLRLNAIQPEGKKLMPVTDAIHGGHIHVGEILQ